MKIIGQTSASMQESAAAIVLGTCKGNETQERHQQRAHDSFSFVTTE